MKRLPPTLLSLAVILLYSQSSSAQDESPAWPVLRPAADQTPLEGTKPLTGNQDLSHQLVQKNDVFLDQQIAETAKKRSSLWKAGSFDPNDRREELSRMLGMDRDQRPETNHLEYYSIQKSQRAVAEGLSIYTVRWKAVGDIHGDGLLIEPEGKDHPIVADVIAIPDAGQTPEEIAGLGKGESDASPYALLLAQAGCRVLIPTLIDREENPYRMTNREWLHRPAFELGRHLLGYELHKVIAGVDALIGSQDGKPDRPVGVIGWGEGGLLALYAGALEPRIDATTVSGYFGPRENLWREPAEHNIHGLLSTFGDAEIASLIAPRKLIIESGVYPDFAFRANEAGELDLMEERAPKSGKPGRFTVPDTDGVSQEVARLQSLLGKDANLKTLVSDSAISGETLAAFAGMLGINPGAEMNAPIAFKKIYEDPAGYEHIAHRHAEQMAEIDRHNQWALVQSRQDRTEYFKDLKTDSIEAFEETIEPYREKFRTEVIGDFEIERIPVNARSRKYEEGPLTVSYEVLLDVLPGVTAYGLLTVPKNFDLSSGEKRPVVVCQHGLEGTPQDVIGEPKFKAYSAFATRLAERGFITFAPQNGYKYFDLFRMQQFKSQSIGKTLFSIIIPQHQQITDWLAGLSFVDPERIAFYGLSYGGKSAMRIPPLVDRYCLSICSADFNEWVWKNAATDPKSLRYSYANKGEYEIFEWNLGGTFNYAEMAALICPRPFMVERGHFDGVGPDEAVAYEFGKVRNLYQARLGIGDLCEIEWFPGPHKINGVGTYAFLEKHLRFSNARRGPAPQDMEKYKALTEDQRTALRDYIRKLMNEHPNLTRDERGNQIREAMRKIARGEKLEK